MRLLILGGNGRLGHRLWMAAREEHETWVTIRGRLDDQPWAPLFEPARTIEGVEAADLASVDRALATSQPDVVVNTLGLVKQRQASADVGASFVANSRLPHYVAWRASESGSRLIHISTDCVFSGERGAYSEGDPPDEFETYGLTKRLGEVGAPHLTIRTSLIGRELAGADGLLEWFLSQRGRRVSGYVNAIFSGLTTSALATTLLALATDHPTMSGLRNVASSPINKYDLLERIRSQLGLDIEIIPTPEPRIDRSLIDDRFRAESGMLKPTWDEMIAELGTDQTPYDVLRAGA
jgi:dTDP-4-dehydrorhamnose reductase